MTSQTDMDGLSLFFTLFWQKITSQSSKASYVLSLGGIAADRKLSKRNPSTYSVFCGIKLQEENSGKLSILSLKSVFTDKILF